MPLLHMSDLNLSGKRVMIREDLNVPVQNGQVTSDARIRAALPTLPAVAVLEERARDLPAASNRVFGAIRTVADSPPVSGERSA